MTYWIKLKTKIILTKHNTNSSTGPNKNIIKNEELIFQKEAEQNSADTLFYSKRI